MLGPAVYVVTLPTREGGRRGRQGGGSGEGDVFLSDTKKGRKAVAKLEKLNSRQN